MAAYKQLVATTLGLNDTSTITVSCRFATNTAGQAIARRLMAAATWVMESLGLRSQPGPLERVRRQLQTGTGAGASGDAKLDVTLTYGAPKTVNPADSATTNCGVMVGGGWLVAGAGWWRGLGGGGAGVEWSGVEWG